MRSVSERAVRAVAAYFSQTPIRSALVLLSLIVVVGVFIVTGTLLQALHLDKPLGIDPNGQFLTLGARTSGGEFVGSRGRDLSSFESTLGGDRLLRYATSAHEVEAEGQRFKLHAAFVNSAFIDQFKPRLQNGRYPGEDERALVISHAYANSHFPDSSSAINKTIRFAGSEGTFLIVGVLVEEFVGLSSNPVDVVLRDVWRKGFLDIDLAGAPISDEVRDSIQRQVVEELPTFGFLELGSSSDVRHLSDTYRRSMAAPGVIKAGPLTLRLAVDEGRELAIAEGIDLDPDRRAVLTRYARYLGAICVTMAIILLVNYAMHLLSRLPARLDEFRVRLVVGATTGNIYRNLFFEQGWLLPAAIVAAVPLAAGALVLMENHQLLRLQEVSPMFQPRMAAIAISGVIWVAIQLLATLVPLWSIRRLFFSGGVVSESRGQRFFRNTTGTLMYFVCFVSAGAVISMGLQLERMSSVPIGAEDIFSGRLDQPGGRSVSSLRSIVSGEDYSFADVRPVGSLDRQRQFRMPQFHDAKGLTAAMTKVSANWPAHMKIPVLTGSLDEWCRDGRVIMSASAAEAMGVSASNLVGQRIIEADGSTAETKGWIVQAVIGNVRYDRLYGSYPAVVYTCGEAVPINHSEDGSVTFSRPWEPAYAFSSDADTLSSLGVHRHSRTSELLKERTALERLLAVTAAIAGSIALLLGFIGLCADSVSLVFARSRENALRLCLGASRTQLVLGLLRERVLSLSCAAGLSVALAALLLPNIKESLPWLTSSELAAVPFAVILAMAFVLAMLVVVVWVNLNPDLANELRRER